jgi:hypothetical protein
MLFWRGQCWFRRIIEYIIFYKINLITLLSHLVGLPIKILYAFRILLTSTRNHIVHRDTRGTAIPQLVTSPQTDPCYFGPAVPFLRSFFVWTGLQFTISYRARLVRKSYFAGGRCPFCTASHRLAVESKFLPTELNHPFPDFRLIKFQYNHPKTQELLETQYVFLISPRTSVLVSSWRMSGYLQNISQSKDTMYDAYELCIYSPV